MFNTSVQASLALQTAQHNALVECLEYRRRRKQSPDFAGYIWRAILLGVQSYLMPHVYILYA